MMKFDLQLFAEGGAGSTAAASAQGSSQANGSNQNPTGTGAAAGNNVTAAEGTTAQEHSEPEESFESLIKGKYKKEYNESIRNAIDARFKDTRIHESNLNKLKPALEALSEHYGLDVGNIDYDKLAQKIMDDSSLYEQKALEKGMEVNEYKRMRAMERELSSLRAEQNRTRQDYERQQQFNKIVEQVPDVQKIYPNFDLGAEIQNPDFFRLVHNGVPVRTAFEVIHRDEIQPAVMQMVAQKTQEQLANSVKANQSRPNETAIGNGGTTVAVDISKLSSKDFKEYQKRAARGERITFK